MTACGPPTPALPRGRDTVVSSLCDQRVATAHAPAIYALLAMHDPSAPLELGTSRAAP